MILLIRSPFLKIYVFRKNNMKEKMYFYAILVLIKLVLSGANDTDYYRERVERYQTAVTSFAGLEDLYNRVKQEIRFSYLDVESIGRLRIEDYQAGNIKYYNYRYLTESKFPYMQPGKEKEYDLEDKSEICARIFNSSFFEWFGQEAVYFDLKTTKTSEELRRNNGKLYDAIYRDWPNNKQGEWFNPIEERELIIGEHKFREKVFRCVTRERETGSFVGYFISSIYQSDLYVENIVGGRFIFTSNATDELKLFAIAEEVAVVDRHVIRDTHNAYYDAYYEEDAGSRQFYGSNMHNPLCKLSAGHKIRLCAQVLNAIEFPDKIKFFPTPDSIEPECVERKVSNFEGPSKTRSILEEDYEIIYDESMIVCKCRSAGANEPSTLTYYVSRGKDRHTAIVFKHFQDNLLSAFVGLTGVRLVSDWGKYIKRVEVKKKKKWENRV